jgi:S-DNA-T family DNA segregation ATPase FtsK/SpoIIIE
LIPVVTEPSKAAAALNWAVAEMTDRYKKFAEEGVRDLESFNNSIRKKGEDERFLPQIVIIIDELADLMMAARPRWRNPSADWLRWPGRRGCT